MCFCYDNIMRVIDIGFSDILLNEKSNKTYENILIYDISYETFQSAKPLHIWFEEIDELIKIFDGIRYLVLFGPEWYDTFFNRIRYLISK